MSEHPHQLVLVYLGDASCTFSEVQRAKRDLARADQILAARAQSEGLGFTRVGIAKASEVDEGLAFLRSLGHFDEIGAGGGWANLGLDKYVVTGLPGPALTPQLLVLRRTVGPSGWGLQSETLALRLVGHEEIARWINRGGPILASPEQGG